LVVEEAVGEALTQDADHGLLHPAVSYHLQLGLLPTKTTTSVTNFKLSEIFSPNKLANLTQSTTFLQKKNYHSIGWQETRHFVVNNW
jgi:hypothetical protein